MSALLEVRELRTWFTTDLGLSRAVDGVSFHVDQGETVGIVGESGCGKSVTALSIMGLLSEPPAAVQGGSSIRFGGEELVGASPARLRALRGNELAMIFQEPMTSLNPVLTIGEQVAEAARSHRRIGAGAAREGAIRLLAEVGIPGGEQHFDSYPHQLSGGMRQRVMIAMALSCEPTLLIADEPTTALDVTIQAQILDLLGHLRERRNMAMLIITHDLGIVAESCDRVVVMYGGRIVETGSVADVLTDPLHPYTRGLTASLPSRSRGAARLACIPGTVPSSTAWPTGCRFRTRCAEAFPRCQEPPPLSGGVRQARCWLHGAAAEDGAVSEA